MDVLMHIDMLLWISEPGSLVGNLLATISHKILLEYIDCYGIHFGLFRIKVTLCIFVSIWTYLGI